MKGTSSGEALLARRRRARWLGLLLVGALAVGCGLAPGVDLPGGTPEDGSLGEMPTDDGPSKGAGGLAGIGGASGGSAGGTGTGGDASGGAAAGGGPGGAGPLGGMGPGGEPPSGN